MCIHMYVCTYTSVYTVYTQQLKQQLCVILHVTCVHPEMGHCPGAQHYVYLKQSRSIRYRRTVEDGKKL